MKGRREIHGKYRCPAVMARRGSTRHAGPADKGLAWSSTGWAWEHSSSYYDSVQQRLTRSSTRTTKAQIHQKSRRSQEASSLPALATKSTEASTHYESFGVYGGRVV